MRTTLDIDDRLLDALMTRSQGLSKTKAIERAIEAYVKTDAYERVRSLRGAFPEMVDTTAELDRLDVERQARIERARTRMILADTSVWIDYLRGTTSAAANELDERLAAHEVLMCGPLATELLTGVGASERVRLWETLDLRLLDG